MNILITSDVPLFCPASGAEQVLNQQAFGLKRKGFRVFAITRINGDSKYLLRNINGVQEACYSLPSKNFFHALFYLLKNPKELYNKFSEEGSFFASIIHQPFTCISLLLSRKLKSIPLIYVFHSPNHEEYLLDNDCRISLCKIPIAYIRKKIEGYCLKKARKIIVLSEYMKNKVKKIHSISDDFIIVNPGGADLNRFQPVEDRHKIKMDLGFPEGKIHLLTIRNLEPRMGLDNLLKGVYLIKKSDLPIHLVIGGEGPEKEKLLRIVKELGIIDEVMLTGFIPAKKLPLYYGAADFFILPTRNLEGFGLVTPESMACGTPVLGTPIGGTKEILKNFDSQFLFEDTSAEAIAKGIQNAIIKYLKVEDKYNQLRTRCREFVVQNYSWQRHVDQLSSIIDGLNKYDNLKN